MPRSLALLVAGSAVGWLLFAPGYPCHGGSIFDDTSTTPQHNTPNVQTAKPPVPRDQPGASSPGVDSENGERHPVPTRADLSASKNSLEESHSAALRDHTIGSRRKLSQALLQEAANSAAGSADQYMLFNGAIDAAVEAHSLRMAMAAVEAQGRVFQIDIPAVEIGVAQKFFVGRLTPALASLGNIEQLLTLIDQAISQDDAVNLNQLTAALKRAMPGISDPDLKSEVSNELVRVEQIRAARSRLTPALAKLKNAPHDAAANLSVGRYSCFLCGQWKTGLPLLSKSNDPLLSGLATAELADASQSDDVIKVAKRWSEAAPKVAPVERPQVISHAIDLYESVKTEMTDAQSSAYGKWIDQTRSITRQRRVDLIDMWDPTFSNLKGTWRYDGGLVDDNLTESSTVDFPYRVPDEYDLRVEFTLSPPVHDAVFTMACQGGHQFTYIVGAYGNSASGVELINNAGVDNNTTTKRRDSWLAAGHHVTLLKVRKGSIQGYFDGQSIVDYKTDYSDMTAGSWLLPSSDIVGVGTYGDTAHFDSVELIEISGHGKYIGS